MKLLLVPHFYMINWAKETSALLYNSNYFLSPYEFNKNAYMPYSKSEPYAEHWLRKSERIPFDGYFFVNIQDYIYSKLEFNKPVFGIIQSTRLSDFESGNSDLTKTELKEARELEINKLNKIEQGFPVSQSLKDSLIERGINCPMDVMGLPVFATPDYDYKERDFKILFNHRMTRQKNPTPLFSFPEEWRRRFIISTPLAFSMAYSKQLKANENIMIINRDNGKSETREKYEQYLRTSKYGITFTRYESFGQSVAESLVSGICYICPNHSQVPFSEFVHPELLYDGSLLNKEKELIKTIINMIEKFEKNDDLRIETIKYSQNKLEKYYPEKWLNNTINTLQTR